MSVNLASLAAVSISAAHIALAALKDLRVTYTEGEWSMTGTLRMSDITTADMSYDGREGFTFNIDGPNGDFIASGVWSDDACGVQNTTPVISAA